MHAMSIRAYNFFKNKKNIILRNENVTYFKKKIIKCILHFQRLNEYQKSENKSHIQIQMTACIKNYILGLCSIDHFKKLNSSL